MKYRFLITKLAVIVTCATLLLACSKSKDEVGPEPEVETFMAGTNWVPSRVKKIRDYVYLDEKYQVVYVVNMPSPDVGHTSAQGHRSIFYNFDSRSMVDSAAAVDRKETWHIKFHDIYNSNLSSDGSTPENSPGEGKMRVIATAFNDLKAAVIDPPMTKNIIPISMDENDPVYSWGYYNFGQHNLWPYKDRSVVLYLRDKRYVKFQLVNLYKDNPVTPPLYTEPDAKNLAPYFNFRYYIQQTPGNINISTK